MHHQGDAAAWRAVHIAQAHDRARTTMRLLTAIAVLGAAATALDVWRWQRVVRASSDREVFGVLDATPALASLLDPVLGTLVVVTVYFWLPWFDHVYRAAATTGRVRPTGEWWFLGWIVPFVNLVLPKRMVNAVWRAGDPAGTRTRPPWPVQAWWVLWVAMWLASGGQSRPADGPRPMADVLRADIVEGLLFAAAAAFAVVTVRILTDRLRRIDEVAPPAPGGVEEHASGAHQV